MFFGGQKNSDRNENLRNLFHVFGVAAFFLDPLEDLLADDVAARDLHGLDDLVV